MSKLNARIVAFSFLFFVTVTASAESPSAELSQASLKQAQAQQVELNRAMAPIKSRADLFTYVHGVAAPLSPLSKLSPGARSRFLASLTFNENGLTGFSYEDLKNELSASDIYKVLSLFGAQHDTTLIKGLRVQEPSDALITASPNLQPLPEDHDGYACVGRATCNTRPSFICMSGC